MKVNVSIIIGLSLATLIITYLIVNGVEKHKNGVKYTASGGIGVAVFTLWALAIYLDILFVRTYTFTSVRGIDFTIGR